MKNEQLQLNYVEITETVGRNYLREHFTPSSKIAYKIPFDKLCIREGFNKRVVYENIEDLAASIKTNGMLEPLTVDIISNGTVYIEKGHRRFKALQLLIEQGEVIDLVECYPNPKSVTEFERMLHQYTSNNFQKKLKPVEAANVAFALKNNFGKILSNEEVAHKMGCSRQSVDNLLLIASAGDEIKNEMIKGDLGITDAIALIKNQKKLKDQADKVETDAAQSTMYTQPLPKDILADEVTSLKELQDKVKVNEDEETDDEETRISTYNPDNQETKPLDLVGNTVANNGKEKPESDGTVKYDESRPEIKQANNIIVLLDKIDFFAEKLPDQQASKDIMDRVKWIRKDAIELRDWVHKNKKQNKDR